MLLTEKPTSVAVVNKQQIIIVKKDGVDCVPIRPICDALGVDFSAQLQRIKRDPIFNSTVVTITTVGADEKDREMVALPHEFIFGWLFTIDTNLVKDEVREAVINYKRECNHVLYNHFKSYADFVQLRSSMIEEAIAVKEAVRVDFNTAKDRLKEADERVKEALRFNFADYIAGKSQLELDFENDGKKEA